MFFSNHPLIICVILLFGFQMGCQEVPPRERGRWYRTSPVSARELGVLVENVDLNSIKDLVHQKKIGARLLFRSTGTFELYGLPTSKVKDLFPGKPVSDNQFIDFNDPFPMDDSTSYSEPPSSAEALEIIQTYAAWPYSQGRGAIVAVIDTGLSWNHTDFSDSTEAKEQNSKGWNFAESNNDLSDPTSHGTAVAGLIGSSKLGVAPLATLLAYKVMNNSRRIDEGSVLAAFRYALNNHIQLIHFSLGSPSMGPVFLNLIREAETKGVMIVTAAGNQGRPCDRYQLFPGALDSASILNVGATQLNSLNPFYYTSYSNFGDCVTLAAPGGLKNKGLWAPLWRHNQSLYQMVAGTSMAAPLVTGAAALIKSRYPFWSGPQIREHLIQTAQKSPELEGYVRSSSLLQIRL